MILHAQERKGQIKVISRCFQTCHTMSVSGHLSHPVVRVHKVHGSDSQVMDEGGVITPCSRQVAHSVGEDRKQTTHEPQTCGQKSQNNTGNKVVFNDRGRRWNKEVELDEGQSEGSTAATEGCASPGDGSRGRARSVGMLHPVVIHRQGAGSRSFDLDIKHIVYYLRQAGLCFYDLLLVSELVWLWEGLCNLMEGWSVGQGRTP